KVQPPADPASDPLWLERQTMSPDWFQRLESEMKQPYFIELKRFLASEDRAGKRTYPPPPLVHSWSRLTPIDRVKVVVVGQDPYHGPNQACGLSFSVNRGVATPPSLRNIYKEIATEYPGFKPPNHGCLDGWATQGVLLLNACLTVSAGQAGSHHGKGWEKLTKHILKLNGGGGGGDDNDNDGDGDGDGKGKGKDKGKGVVFLVWGAPAAKTLAEAGVTDTSGNVLILKSPHPSPLSAHRGFLGNGHFVKANTWLQQRYGPDGGIDWTKL
ncbi:uracil-DNA glycosylase, partial [Testicularia cyperi]